MFTKNFKYWIMTLAFDLNATASQMGNVYKDYNGTTRVPSNYVDYFDSSAYWPGMNVGLQKSISRGVVLGTGDAEPTEDDYTLSGTIITTFGVSSTTEHIYNSEDGSYTIENVYTITNTGSSTFTIKEIAWFANFFYGGGTSYACFLIDRTLLEEPITLEAGQVGQVTYTRTIKF